MWSGQDFDGSDKPSIQLATTNTVAIPQDKLADYLAANTAKVPENA